LGIESEVAAVLRLPSYRYHRPRDVAEAVGLKAQHGEAAMYIAGGTDLIPNMKHRLFEPEHLISLRKVSELNGIELSSGELSIGAAVSLASIARDSDVKRIAPALAAAAGHVAGPQLRNSGTLGGNLCLDTRCTYYNQTEFWRQALGYCLKKDGTVCHVTRVGAKCVAAHSADTPPALIVHNATVDLVGPDGPRSVLVNDLFRADGIWNSTRTPDEIVTRIRIPIRPERRSSYAKLRQRGSIDFPLLTVCVSAEFDDGRVTTIDGVVTALGARPKRLTGWDVIAEGQRLDEAVIDQLAARAHKQCTPLENIIVDPEWRKAMVPVYVTRALQDLAIS
jgi:4-hydroxybenzoyl-CoA reductase subunit beta